MATQQKDGAEAVLGSSVDEVEKEATEDMLPKNMGCKSKKSAKF